MPIKTSVQNNQLNLFCNVSDKFAISAINRASSHQCKQELLNISCLSQKGILYPKQLPNYCPLKGKNNSFKDFIWYK